MPEPAPAVLDRLRAVRGFVLDMDGTLVLGDRNNRGIRALPGAVEFTRLLGERGTPFCVFTNGTVKTPGECADALQQAGFPVAAGIETLPPLRSTTADAVFAGWYRQELTFEALEAACFAVLEGAKFYSASQSPFFATAEGRTLGTSRAISAVVHDVTRARVTVVGKPAVQALQASARHLGVPAAELAVVGDDPELEVPMAHKGGALAVAVHTGIGHAESFADLPEDARPHLDLADVGVLAQLLVDG